MATRSGGTRVGPPDVIHLATGNRHKAREMQALVEATGLALQLRAAAVMPPVAEDTGTFVGNARKKAEALRATLPAGAWVLADDSGLCVDALGGAPGVESAYFAGPAGDSAANLARLLQLLATVPPTERGARFQCVLVLLAGGSEHVFAGECVGWIATHASGGAGFGYDPAFVPAGMAKSFGELTEREKNEISHRARAWRCLAQWLTEQAEAGSGL